MNRVLVFVIVMVAGTVCHAQACISEIQNLRNSFEQRKPNCAQSNLNYDYVGRLEPDFADKVPNSVLQGKACIPAVQSYDSKAAVCDATAKQATAQSDPNNLVGYSGNVISAMNDASACVEAGIGDVYQSFHSTEIICMSAQEGILRANDQCDVDMTNLSVKAQRLRCQSQDPNEAASFQSQRQSLVSDIARYADQMNA